MTSRPATVRVAGGQGFWGDWLEAPYRQVTGGPIDYLMMDYLAEVTMSILQKQKSRDPARGYATDFITQMERILPIIAERGIKVTANAGGVNARGCAMALLFDKPSLRTKFSFSIAMQELGGIVIESQGSQRKEQRWKRAPAKEK